MLTGILGGEVDAVTRMGLVREAEGNPLYLEELSRALLEGGLEPRGRTWTITVRADLLPPALENLLVARIDRLSTGSARARIRRRGDRPHVPGARRSRRSSVVTSARALPHSSAPRSCARLAGTRSSSARSRTASAQRRAVDGHADTKARALRARRLCVSSRSTPTRWTITSSGSRTTTRRRGIFRRRSSTPSAPGRHGLARLALEPPVLGVPERVEGWTRTNPRTFVDGAAASGTWKSGITGTSFAHLPSAGSGHAPAAVLRRGSGRPDRDLASRGAGSISRSSSRRRHSRRWPVEPVENGLERPGEEATSKSPLGRICRGQRSPGAKVSSTSTPRCLSCVWSKLEHMRARGGIPRCVTKRSERRSPAQE